jgi:hypothetical protein
MITVFHGRTVWQEKLEQGCTSFRELYRLYIGDDSRGIPVFLVGPMIPLPKAKLKLYEGKLRTHEEVEALNQDKCTCVIQDRVKNSDKDFEMLKCVAKKRDIATGIERLADYMFKNPFNSTGDMAFLNWTYSQKELREFTNTGSMDFTIWVYTRNKSKEKTFEVLLSKLRELINPHMLQCLTITDVRIKDKQVDVGLDADFFKFSFTVEIDLKHEKESFI